mmetsp:Transcript_38751/g.51059  ORF Transcript_38751/g.51059 Transcript_38751/m.51059 type:complete len:309 (-) Transcript_38751:184-1110(-)
MDVENRSRKKLAGLFENYVNVECASLSPVGKRVMEITSEIAHSKQMTVKWAGSVEKKTYIDRYSDHDLWVDSYGRPICMTEREDFAELVVEKLHESGEFVRIGNVRYNPCATFFTVNGYRFDLIFPYGDWVNTSEMMNPDSSKFKEQFFKKFDRQRATKGLKLLSKKNPRFFPKIPGLRLERLVVASSTEADLYSEHVEYPSGFFLFRTCLFNFVFSRDGDDLVQYVSERIDPVSEGDEWKLKESVFEKWKSNARFVLASIHQLREKQMDDFSMKDFEDALKLSPQKIETSNTTIDHLNRVVYSNGDV